MLLAALLFITYLGISQERFNKRYDSGLLSTNFYSVIEIDGGYFCTGFSADTLGLSNGIPTIYTKIDYEGNVILQKKVGGDEVLQNRLFSSQNPDLQFLNDSTLMHSGVTYDADWVRQGYIMKVNLEGDTLAMNRFYSPNYPQEFPLNQIITTRSNIAFDGNILVSSQIENIGTFADAVSYTHLTLPTSDLV